MTWPSKHWRSGTGFICKHRFTTWICKQLLPIRKWKCGGQIKILHYSARHCRDSQEAWDLFVLLITPDGSIVSSSMEMAKQSRNIREGTLHSGKKIWRSMEELWTAATTCGCWKAPRDLTLPSWSAETHEQRKEPEQVPQSQRFSGTLGILFKASATILTHRQIIYLFCAVSLLMLCLFLAHLAQEVLRGMVHIPLCFGSA